MDTVYMNFIFCGTILTWPLAYVRLNSVDCRRTLTRARHHHERRTKQIDFPGAIWAVGPTFADMGCSATSRYGRSLGHSTKAFVLPMVAAMPGETSLLYRSTKTKTEQQQICFIFQFVRLFPV